MLPHVQAGVTRLPVLGAGEEVERLHKWHTLARQLSCDKGRKQAICPFFRRTRWGREKLPKDSQWVGKWIHFSDLGHDFWHTLLLRSLLEELCIYEFLKKDVCGARWEAGAVHIHVCDFPGLYATAPFFSFLNLKVTLLEAPNVELTLNWKEDLFRARALFLWIFCLTNHGECELGEKSAKETAHSFQGVEEPFWRRKVSPFSGPFDSLWVCGRKTWRNYSDHPEASHLLLTGDGSRIKHREIGALIPTLQLTSNFHTMNQ